MLKALVILSSVYYCLGNPSIEEDYYSYSYYPSYYYYNYYTELPNFDEWWWYCDGEFCTDSYIWASWLLKNDISIFISKYVNFQTNTILLLLGDTKLVELYGQNAAIETKGAIEECAPDLEVKVG